MILGLDLRFLGKIFQQESGCWIWLGTKDRDGYVRIKVGGKKFYAHRWIYEKHKGPIPDGFHVDHLCKVRNCVNPDHLEAVTPKENVHRSQHHNTGKTQCLRGHPFSPENTRVKENGGRSCRTCDRDSARAYYANNKEQVIEKQRARRARRRGESLSY